MSGRALKAKLSVGVCLAWLTSIGAAAAQPPEQSQASKSQPPSSDAQSGAQVGEVIVTATKRAENIQDVPVAVQAIGGSQLRQMNITSLGDLTKLAPSFNFAENYTPRTEATFIRGIGTYTTSDAIEPSVGVVVDGVALGRQGMAYIDPFDVSQIEVLRGPQGTLFGKNASAGVVSINTQAPSLTPQMSARALFGNRDEEQYGVSVAGAIAPDVATRFTAYYNTRDGEYRDTYYNRNINDSNNYGFRGKVRFEEGSADVTFIADYNRAYATCCAWIAAGDGGPGAFRNLLTDFGLTAGEKNYNVAANVLPESRSTSGGLSMTAHVQRGGEDVTSITAIRDWQTYEVADLDQLPVDLANSYNRSRQYQISEELRASNSGSSTWAHTVGIYYFHYLIKDNSLTEFPASGDFFGPLGFVDARALQSLTYDNGAVFGELTHTFPDQATKLRVGVRVTAEKVGTDISRDDNIQAIPGFSDYRLQDSDTNVGESFVIALQHQFTSQVMAYTQVARGFKGAAYDLPASTDPAPSELVSHRVAPETAMNYEVGVRSELFDRTLTFNATAFYEKFDNYQSTTFDASANVFRLGNVGSLSSRGVELEFAWRPTRDLTFGGGLTYADARYDNYKNGECEYTFYSEGLCTEVAPGAYTINLSGRSIDLAPKWNLVVNSRYDFRDVPGPFDAYIAGNYAYRSATTGDPSVDPANYIHAYGLLDARLALTSKDKRFELALYAKNLNDQNYFQAHFPATLFGGLAQGNNATDAFQGLRRSFGVELVGRF